MLFRSRSQLFDSITSHFICQELFSSFFKFIWAVSIQLLSPEQLGYINSSSWFCQVLFSSFSKILSIHLFGRVSRGQLRYISTPPPICQAQLYKFRHLFSLHLTIKKEPLSRLFFSVFIQRHQSGHSRHRFSYRPQQSFRRYPDPGKQRSYDPADSSASPLPLWSWA